MERCLLYSLYSKQEVTLSDRNWWRSHWQLSNTQ